MGEIRRITDLERELQGQVDRLSAQIDEQGGQLVAWRDRAIKAEMGLVRLREPVRSLAECRVGPCKCDPHVEYCGQCAPFMIRDGRTWDGVPST